MIRSQAVLVCLIRSGRWGNKDTGHLGQWGALNALVTEVTETRQAIAGLQAQEMKLLADAVDLVAARTAERQATDARWRSSSDLPLREVSAELAAAMRLSDRTVQGRMSDAFTLTTRLPATLAAWEAGRIDAGHMNAIVDAGAAITDDALRARFEELALAVAESESPARLQAAAGSIAATVDPDGVAERIRDAQDTRRMGLRNLGDGMGRVFSDVPLLLGQGILDRMTGMARDVLNRDPDESCDAEGVSDGVSDAATVVTGPARGAGADGETSAGDTRTLDQVRVDIFCDLLLAGGPVAHGDGLAAVQGHVQVQIPATTLTTTKGTAGSAFLVGHGPVDPDAARCLAGLAPTWDRVITDPDTGRVLSVQRYRRSEEMGRFLRARDEHCRFPGCRRPVRRCDLDHTVDHALGGKTTCGNLAHLCRRHHTLKHHTDWQVRQLSDGVLEWTSPTGRTYIDRPPGMVRFVPSHPANAWDDDPPLFEHVPR